MLTLMIFATLFLPFYYLIKFVQRYNIDFISVIGFNNDYPDGTSLDIINESNVMSIKENYDRVLIKFCYLDHVYKYVCLSKHLNLPLQIKNKKQTSFITKAEIVCENNTYDVTKIVKTYSGPNDDFFENPFNMYWIFPEYKDNQKPACLKLYNNNKLQHNIDLLTNEEILDNDDTDNENKERQNDIENDFILYDSDVDSFILEENSE